MPLDDLVHPFYVAVLEQRRKRLQRALRAEVERILSENLGAPAALLVVPAACWGSGVMAAIGGGEHVAPFASAVGLRTEVTEGRLRDAMRELYRCLNDKATTLAESVESAQRELAAGQELRLEVIVLVAAKMLVTLSLRRRAWVVGPFRWRRNARLAWDRWFPPFLQEQVPAYRFENVPLR